MGSQKQHSNLADQIYEDLLGQILREELKPGTRLPSERELAQTYGTNRNTLREAIRKLEHMRLVQVRHGQGVTVADFRRTATVEVLGSFLPFARDNSERMRTFVDLLMARAQVLEMSIACAAQRATEDDIARIDDLVAIQLDNFERRDRDQLVMTDIKLINALVDAAHSVTARWIANTLLEVYQGLVDRTTSLWVVDDTFPTYLRTLTQAIADGDAQTAIAATRDYYTRVDQQLLSLLNLLPKQSEEAGDSAS